jgi:hypothetical protein
MGMPIVSVTARQQPINTYCKRVLQTSEHLVLLLLRDLARYLESRLWEIGITTLVPLSSTFCPLLLDLNKADNPGGTQQK